MSKVIQSAGGIVYYIWSDGEPRYLLIKRHAISKKVERVAPKGKIQEGEAVETAALREVSEETGIPINKMTIKQKIGMTQLRSQESHKGQIDKDTTYFLVEYSGEPDFVHIDQVEGYIGIYKWATINEVLWLLYYQDIRELIRESYHIIKQWNKKDQIKKDFMKKLDI